MYTPSLFEIEEISLFDQKSEIYKSAMQYIAGVFDVSSYCLLRSPNEEIDKYGRYNVVLTSDNIQSINFAIKVLKLQDMNLIISKRRKYDVSIPVNGIDSVFENVAPYLIRTKSQWKIIEFYKETSNPNLIELIPYPVPAMFNHKYGFTRGSNLGFYYVDNISYAYIAGLFDENATVGYECNKCVCGDDVFIIKKGFIQFDLPYNAFDRRLLMEVKKYLDSIGEEVIPYFVNVSFVRDDIDASEYVQYRYAIHNLKDLKKFYNLVCPYSLSEKKDKLSMVIEFLESHEQVMCNE